MEPQEKLTTQQFIIDRLHDIQRKAESNKYTDALTAIKELKATDAKNIYIIAIEKQIAKLSEGGLLPEVRTELVKSLPSMIDRAISDIQRKASIPKAEEVQKEQKEAALEKLKSQYFQRADDYVEKQEYQRALEEIRRIYIIEPGSVVAKEYEQKIEQLANLQVRAESAPQKVEVKETESADTAVDTQEGRVILEEEPEKSKLPLYIGAAALLVIIILVVWFFFIRGHNNIEPSQVTTQQSQPSPAPVSETPAATNPAPQTTEKAAPPEIETPKATSKTKKTPEVKPVTISQPSKTPKATQPERKQPAPQPVVAAPPPAPEKPKETESAPVAVPFVAIQETPKVVHRQNPEYPAIALKLGIEGRVVVEVTVDAQGRPIQANVVESSSDIFDESATEAAMKTTYKPAVMSTGPITAKIRVTFDFHLAR